MTLRFWNSLRRGDYIYSRATQEPRKVLQVYKGIKNSLKVEKGECTVFLPPDRRTDFLYTLKRYGKNNPLRYKNKL